ncbi:probable E3 ubiquitin-protein ligase RHG1A isoform X2 [Coffea arabica]|uniref:RING-type E3 ubiquitin transferase n=1 Tax=Coffea arabica TaxID=13443 RepID=A0A6P6UP22_COFAR|nr:probable E3 ubiquitin-protein ligase RHG1A isoform X2 [Coffea arabica]
MQGQRSAVGSLPEVLGIDHGSTSSDTSLDQQVHWNSIRNSSQNRIPDYLMSPTDTSVGFLNTVNQPGQNLSGWDFGESSSRGEQGEVSETDRKNEHGWSSPINVCAGAALGAEGQQYGPSNILSLNNVGVNMHSNEGASGTFFMQNSGSESIRQDLNMNSDIIVDEDDDCQVLECQNAFKASESVNERMLSASNSSNPFGMSSGTGGFLVEEADGRPGCSLDGRRFSCKRKTLEGNAGQSSGSGSSNLVQHAESNLFHSVPARHNASSSTGIAAPSENNSTVNLPGQVIPRLGLSVGRASSDSHPPLTASGTAESSRRNFRLRINASHQQDSSRNNIVSTETDVGNPNSSSAQHSFRLLPRNNSLDLRPASMTDSGSSQGQSVVVHVSSVRRNPHSRWNGASSSRTGSSSSFAISGDIDAVPYEESSSSSVARHISEHPMFVPPTEIRNSSQNPPNWSLAGGSVGGNPGNVASTSRTGSSAVVHSSTPTWTPPRNPSQYPRRLSEFVRRSSSSSADSDSGGHSSNYPSLRTGPSSSQDMPLSSGSGSQGRHAASSRSAILLERHLDTAFGSYSLRNLAAASEGRNRLMSEIRNVLDLMRRGGEGLRFEDVMVLDQSVFFGMADFHDRHRDMRLDVDNMSYEELLALEERIGNVSTGLSEETILKQLKQRKYVSNKTVEVETEPCCVCQEEYSDGEDLGSLDCGHDFHAECIKQWLTHKNLCPICKTTGLAK